MSRSPKVVSFPLTEDYSEIIDVRSEGEFAEDRVPGAINLPVLNNEERGRVGTIYHQESAFEASKIGAALIAKNIARYLETHFANRDKSYRPIIYCWRGGQRSNSLARVLSEIGWPTLVVKGGYKAYRSYVRQQLDSLAAKIQFKILCGFTGTGKTAILRQLQRQGTPVLDLEGLANHRGSLLGQEWATQPEPQPSQKYFESLLLQHLQQFTPQQTVWVESESNKIGQLHVPTPLWEQMKQAPCIEVRVPLTQRVQFLLRDYPHLGDHPDFLKGKLAELKSRHGKQKLAQWCAWIDGDRPCNLIQDLLETHYDPAYERSMNKDYYPRLEERLFLPDLSPDSIESAARRLAEITHPTIVHQ